MSTNEPRVDSDTLVDQLFGDSDDQGGVNEADDIGGERLKIRDGLYILEFQKSILGEQKKNDDQPYLVFEWEVAEVLESRISVDWHSKKDVVSNLKGSETSNWFDLSRNRKGFTTAAKYNLRRVKIMLAALFSEPSLGEEMTAKQISNEDVRKATKSELQKALVGTQIVVDIGKDKAGYLTIDAWHPDSEKHQRVMDALAQIKARSAAKGEEDPIF